MKKIYSAAVAVLLAACSGNSPDVQPSAQADFNPASQARIRLYGQNQKPAIMTYGIDCASGQKGKKVNIGGSLGDAFGSFTGTAKNTSIGIPETAHSRQLKNMDGILSKAFYREMAIPANQAVNVRTAFIGLSNTLETEDRDIILREKSCTSHTASFVPQPGKDYEVIGVKGRGCGVAVYEIDTQGRLTAVPLQEQLRCQK